MKYEEPEAVVLESICTAIQMVEKLTGPLETANMPSIPAYEADE